MPSAHEQGAWRAHYLACVASFVNPARAAARAKKVAVTPVSVPPPRPRPPPGLTCTPGQEQAALAATQPKALLPPSPTRKGPAAAAAPDWTAAAARTPSAARPPWRLPAEPPTPRPLSPAKLAQTLPRVKGLLHTARDGFPAVDAADLEPLEPAAGRATQAYAAALRSVASL